MFAVTALVEEEGAAAAAVLVDTTHQVTAVAVAECTSVVGYWLSDCFVFVFNSFVLLLCFVQQTLNSSHLLSYLLLV